MPFTATSAELKSDSLLHQINSKVNERQLAALLARVEAETVTIAAVVRRAVVRYLENETPPRTTSRRRRQFRSRPGSESAGGS